MADLVQSSGQSDARARLWRKENICQESECQEKEGVFDSGLSFFFWTCLSFEAGFKGCMYTCLDLDTSQGEPPSGLVLLGDFSPQ